jgi:hypothetical protein
MSLSEYLFQNLINQYHRSNASVNNHQRTLGSVLHIQGVAGGQQLGQVLVEYEGPFLVKSKEIFCCS